MSSRTRVEVEPLRLTSLHGDTAGTAFHLLRMRCGSCHDVPDSRAKEAGQWGYTVGRMREKMTTAGLIPMTEEEADSVATLLVRHARR